MTDDKTQSCAPGLRERAFLNSPDGRIFRILSEYTEPLARFRREQIQDTVVFFGSARFHSQADAQTALAGSKVNAVGRAPCSPSISAPWPAVDMARYYEDARRLAFLLTNGRSRFPPAAAASWSPPAVVPASWKPPISALRRPGARPSASISICPSSRVPIPTSRPSLNFEFHYFFMRKFWFAYLAKALVIFPGGFGTMDELFEILTLAQTQKLAKKIIVVIYGSEYWKQCNQLPGHGRRRHHLAGRRRPFQNGGLPRRGLRISARGFDQVPPRPASPAYRRARARNRQNQPVRRYGSSSFKRTHPPFLDTPVTRLYS